MADTDEPTTDEPTTVDTTAPEQDTSPPDTAAGEPAPAAADPAPNQDDPAEDDPTEAAPAEGSAAEQPTEPAPAEDGPVTEQVSEAAAAELRLQADAETLAAAAIPPARPADAEAEAPRFGAQFSSPEPTTVTARPRRRATRPALSADPDSVEPAPAVAPTIPAFITFVAPPEEAEEPPAPPRRRSRRTQAETPAEPAETATSTTEDDATDLADSAPDESTGRSRRSRSRRKPPAEPAPADDEDTVVLPAPDDEDSGDDTDDDDPDTQDPDTQDSGSAGSRRRRRGRRGRGRGRTGEDDDAEDRDAGSGADSGSGVDPGSDDDEDSDDAGSDGDTEDPDDAADGSASSTRRRRRRRRRGEPTGDTTDTSDDDRPERAGRNGRDSSDDAVRGVAGSTRLEAKRQRRRDGRDTGRRRAPILSESEFLARREAVDRAMVIRQQGDRTQIAVLEDDVLVEHYVTQAQSTSFAGNVYLGRVQNVLPSMEAAFVDIGKGRNAVLYAGEVNWDTAGLSGKSRSIEQALKSGDKVLCQVTKDPIGHKGARLTQQINLPGRFLVYVPGGSMTGISRKLPDNERQRLKDILKKIVPEDAGVIIRTAAEGASEEELTRDVARLQAQWEVIQTKASSASNAPTLLYGEPDLAIRVIRDVFNEDFKRLVVQGNDAWDTVEAYVAHVSPELSERVQRHIGTSDVFGDLRIDEQLMKALDRKVWLPSGGSLVIDRTEAMTVVDVNTGKFVGSGGNLEQTVTRNNMEAAEEIVRQLRLRDIGGMIVIDFIDMVLESNRELVLRRLTECLGRDRTKHQVAEVTSLGLVQMTRKRVGQGLLEVFSEPCEHCRGRGVMVQLDPVDERKRAGSSNAGSNGPAGNGGGRGRDGGRGNERQAEVPAQSGADDDAAGGPDDSGDTQPESSGRSGRRNRGRRNRGRNGDEQVAEDAAVLDASRGTEAADEHEVADPVDTEEVVADTGGQLAVDTDTYVVEPTDDGEVPAPSDHTGADRAGAVADTPPGERAAEVADEAASVVPGQIELDLPEAAEAVTEDTAATATDGDAGPEPTVDVGGPVPPVGDPSHRPGQPAPGTEAEAGEQPVGGEQPVAGEQPEAGEQPVTDEEPASSAVEPPVARPRRRRGASRPAGPPA